MRRFNQYMNGEREFKLDEMQQLDLKDESIIKQEKAQKEYDKFLTNLEKERTTLKELILNCLLCKGLFIDDMLSEQQRDEVREQTKVENFEIENPPDNLAHFSCNIVDLLMDKAPVGLDKTDYLQSCVIVMGGDKDLNEKFKIYTGEESKETLICKTRVYVSIPRARVILFKDETDEQINEFNEIKYQETGEEKQISIDASNSRPYTDFFDEFVPNKTEESKRAHKYSVSIHRAISYSENFEVFK